MGRRHKPSKQIRVQSTSSRFLCTLSPSHPCSIELKHPSILDVSFYILLLGCPSFSPLGHLTQGPAEGHATPARTAQCGCSCTSSRSGGHARTTSPSLHCLPANCRTPSVHSLPSPPRDSLSSTLHQLTPSTSTALATSLYTARR